MTTGRRKSSASALRLAMQFARQQLRTGLRVSKLSIAATLFCASSSYLQAQEKEPPRLFRGGLVHQLRSLTVDSSQSRTDEAPTRRDTENHISDPAPAIPKPRAVNEKSRASTPTESRSANLRATQQGPTRSAPQAKAPVTPNANSNAKTRATNETYSNAPAAIGSTRPAELGIPVTNSKLANEARFQLSDKPDSNGEGYSSKSKYDPAKSKDGASAKEGDSKFFSDSPKVQAVESMGQAPKVSRKPLPDGSQAVPKTATKPADKTQQQSSAQKPTAVPIGLKPTGGTYALEQSDKSEPKQADPAPKPTEYPSLQAPSFAAPGATNSKNSSAPSAPKLPQFPTPPASLNNSLPLSTALPKATETKVAEPKINELNRNGSKPTDLPALLPSSPAGFPSSIGLPGSGGLPTSHPALLPEVPALPAP